MTRLMYVLGEILSPTTINIPKANADRATVALVLSWVFGVAGAIAVLIFTIAGFQYVISQGDPQKIAKAKNTMIFAAVGLAIILTAFAIVRFVATRVT